MPKLFLYDQTISHLKNDNTMDELTIMENWLTTHSVDQINLLSQKYPNVTRLNLSDIDLRKADLNKIIALTTAFPEIVGLVLANGSEDASKVIQPMVVGLKLLTELTFADPPSPPAVKTSLFSPSSWGLNFWAASSPASAKSPTEHHHIPRDLFGDISKISEGQSNILGDWNRLDAGPLEINGVHIQKLVSSKADGSFFANLDELQAFFKAHLLCNLKESQQADALKYVMKVLHQGGLLNPVTSAVFLTSASKPGLPQPVDVRSKKLGVPGQYRDISFHATETGFTVHETLRQNRMAYTIDAGDKAGELLLPDKGSEYVFKAEAIVSVAWTPNNPNPTVNVGKIGVTFGSAEAKSLFDGRWLFQKLIDNVGYYTGFNAITESSGPKM